MKSLVRCFVVFGLCVALVNSTAAQKKSGPSVGTKTSPGSSEYFPLVLGTQWVYNTSDGKVTIQVLKHEEIGSVMCAQLVGTTADNNKHTEYCRVTSDGVYRHQAGGQTISGPLRILKLPVKDKDEWTVSSKVLGKSLKGTFKTSITEITVLGKKYENVIMVKSEDFTVDGQNVPHIYYFAKGIGIIKQVVTFAGLQIVVELESFEPGDK